MGWPAEATEETGAVPMFTRFTRRAALTLGAAATGSLMVPAMARAQDGARRNISSFAMQDWRDHFDALGKACIVQFNLRLINQGERKYQRERHKWVQLKSNIDHKI